MRSPSLSSLDELRTALEHHQIVNNFYVCTICILVYEYCIILDYEIEYVWKARWNTMKVLYLASRYIPFIDTTVAVCLRFLPHLSSRSCHNLFNVAAWSVMVGMCLSEVIFTLRTWGVWRRARWLTFALPLFHISVFTGEFIVTGIAINTLEFAAQDFMPRGCLATGGGERLISIDWALLFAYDLGIMILMVIPTITAFREKGRSQMTKTVLSDGIIYYVYLSVVSLANLITIFVLSPDYFDLLLMFGRVIHAVLACRVVLHARRLGQHREVIGLLTTTVY